MSSLTEISDKLIESTVEIFTGMIMMDITVKDDNVKQLGKLQNSITGMVGLAGICKGVVAIHVPQEVAFSITTNFLGMEVTEMNEDVQDAIGEIANMLGGNVKTILSDKGKAIQLSLPSTISGDEYQMYSNDNVERVIIEFSTSGGNFFVDLELESEPTDN